MTLLRPVAAIFRTVITGMLAEVVSPQSRASPGRGRRLLVGVLLSATLKTFVPDDSLSVIGSGLLPMLVITAISVPRVCHFLNQAARRC